MALETLTEAGYKCYTVERGDNQSMYIEWNLKSDLENQERLLAFGTF